MAITFTHKSGSPGAGINIKLGTGKLLGRSSAGEGFVEEVTGPAGAIVGTSDTQTLTNKTITSAAFSGTHTGDFVTANAIRVDGAGGAYITADKGASGDEAFFEAKTAGVARWAWGSTNAAETGSNAGSDWTLVSYTDAGAYLDQPIRVNRATGNVTISNDLTVSGEITMGGSATGPLFRINASSGLAGVYVNAASSEAAYLFFAEAGTEKGRITSDSSGNLILGTGSGATTALTCTGANVTVAGALSKGSGSFKIDHPLKPDTHHLVHSFIEGPQADNIYRGKARLINGKATVNLDEAGRMTEGTFVALNTNVQCFTSNEEGWTPLRGKVNGNILTIEAQDPTYDYEVSWLVIGERHDPHMLETDWTDENGRVITEPPKEQINGSI